jgi:branched-subunit amino acid aminotransferase/4-amino-4-deoxychorismate lyase
LSERLWSTAFAAGFGVYETLRVDAGCLRYADEHVARLLQSARLIDLAHGWTLPQIVSASQMLVQSLCDGQPNHDFNLRMLLLGGPATDAAELWMHAQDRRVPSPLQYTQGVTAQTARAERYQPLAKSMGQLAAYQAYRAASALGHYEALLVDPSGMICEGSRSNFVALQGETMIVALRDAVLGGVTQMHVEALAQTLGLRVATTGVHRTALASLDSAFLCGTSIGILPLCAVDAVPLAVDSPPMVRLRDAWLRASS